MDPTISMTLLWGLIAVALLFDFLNGLHDAANSIATIVSTRVLSLRSAGRPSSTSSPSCSSASTSPKPSAPASSRPMWWIRR
jgi:hypothetical protein